MKVERKLAVSAITIGMIITFFASSIKGSYQVYFLDLASLFGINQGEFAFSGAIFGLIIGIISPAVGFVCDKFGPIKTILSGVLTAVWVFLSLSYTTSFSLFIFFYGVLGAYSLAAMTFVPLGILVDEIFYHEKKGMAYAAIMNGTAIGFMVLSPFWVWLNTFVNWHKVSLGIAMVFLFIIAPAVYWLSLKLPKHREIKSSVNLKPSNQLLKLPFILMATSFAGCGASMAFIDIQLVPLITERLSEVDDSLTVTIASTLSVFGALELIGGFIVGWLLPRHSPALLLATLYSLRATSMIVIFYADTPEMFILFSIIFGLTYMGTVIITSMMCLQQYGSEIKGKMFGYLFTVHQAAVFITIWGGGKAIEVYNSYSIVVLAITAICMCSTILSLVMHSFFQKENTEIKAIQSLN